MIGGVFYYKQLSYYMQAFEIYYTNPVHQSLKYKANEYIAKWIPELSHVTDNKIHAPWMFKGLIDTTHYPKPIEVYKKWSRSINRIMEAIKEQ
ncbi:MAG: FAD-binding domain-containing protein [Aquaticitalea sp.]